MSKSLFLLARTHLLPLALASRRNAIQTRFVSASVGKLCLRVLYPAVPAGRAGPRSAVDWASRPRIALPGFLLLKLRSLCRVATPSTREQPSGKGHVSSLFADNSPVVCPEAATPLADAVPMSSSWVARRETWRSFSLRIGSSPACQVALLSSPEVQQSPVRTLDFSWRHQNTPGAGRRQEAVAPFYCLSARASRASRHDSSRQHVIYPAGRPARLAGLWRVGWPASGGLPVQSGNEAV